MFCTNIFPISKATGLDGTFPPAWIGTGIAYAAQEEGDQAMAAFRTAALLFPGSVIPFEVIVCVKKLLYLLCYYAVYSLAKY